jgi:GGDEF domain-containing protein
MSANESLAPAPSETLPATVSPEQERAGRALASQEWHDITAAYVTRAQEDDADLSVLLVDINALKPANDEIGHHAGDQLIGMVDRLAAVIPRNVRLEHDPDRPDRPVDIMTVHASIPPELERYFPGITVPHPQSARIGGDEFGILLPGTDREGANTVVKRLREAVTHELGLPENQPLAELGAGIAVGSATLEPGMTSSDFLRHADTMMYADKLRQLRKLSPEEEAAFTQAVDLLEQAGVRPRDVPKYLQMLGASAVSRAIRGHKQQREAGQLSLLPEVEASDETPTSQELPPQHN